jgi:nucleotide-binding universal stress UspA family protein
MMKHFSNPSDPILVAVNLDESAQSVLTAARQWALRLKRPIKLMHVCDYWVGRTWANDLMLGGAVLSNIAESAEEEAINAAKKSLDVMAKNFLQGVETFIDVVVGFSDEAIRAQAVTSHAACIMVGGTHAEYRFVPKGLSTVLSLLSESSCPVVVIPKGWKGHFDQAVRILVGDDLTAQSETAVHAGYALAANFGAQTQVLHCHVNQMTKEALTSALSTASAAAHAPESALNRDDIWQAAQQSLEKRLSLRAMDQRIKIAKQGGHVQDLLLNGDASELLLKTANDKDAHLLVFGRHRTWRQKPFSVGHLPFHSMLKSGKPIVVVG